MKLLSGLIRVEYKINEMKIIVSIPLVTCYVKYIVNVFASWKTGGSTGWFVGP